MLLPGGLRVLPRGSLTPTDVQPSPLGSCAASRAGRQRRGRQARGVGSSRHPSGRGPAAGHGALLQEKNKNKESTDLRLACESPPSPKTDGHPSCAERQRERLLLQRGSESTSCAGSAIFLHTHILIHTHQSFLRISVMLYSAGRGSERSVHSGCSTWLSLGGLWSGKDLWRRAEKPRRHLRQVTAAADEERVGTYLLGRYPAAGSRVPPVCETAAAPKGK